MQIIGDTGKMNLASGDLLRLSRTLRSLREELAEVRLRLRRHTQLDACRAELKKQEEQLSLLTANLVNLSTAMEKISSAYSQAERRNVDALEESASHPDLLSQVSLGEVGDAYWSTIVQILTR